MKHKPNPNAEYTCGEHPEFLLPTDDARDVLFVDPTYVDLDELKKYSLAPGKLIRCKLPTYVPEKRPCACCKFFLRKNTGNVGLCSHDQSPVFVCLAGHSCHLQESIHTDECTTPLDTSENT